MFGFIRYIAQDTKIAFMRHRRWAFPLSIATMAASILLFALVGLNLGIDFKGGATMEVSPLEGTTLSVGDLRASVEGLGLGDVEIQERISLLEGDAGQVSDYLLRVELQDGGEKAPQAALDALRAALKDKVDLRLGEAVGPRVSGELMTSGIRAVLVALFAVLLYIWFRFEWQFALGAIAALVHDVILTIGMFCVTRYEFDLASIAAILTIVGYSLNDTVVVYDRVRENLRRYKKMRLLDLIDLSVNQMLTRTIITSVTTLLALAALYLFGGTQIRGFTFAMMWGVLIGTYSSIFIAAPLLMYFGLRPGDFEKRVSAEEKFADSSS